MEILTRDFGKLEVKEEDFLRFISPILGFDGLNTFALITNEELGNDFVWLQSVEDSNVCFILANPYIAVPDYGPKLTVEINQKLGMGLEQPMFWALTVISDNFFHSTMNLKSPIVLNPKNGLGLQMVTEEDYSLKHPIFQQGESLSC